jgi:transcriptional regulator with XRE-family HTH domain
MKKKASVIQPENVGLHILSKIKQSGLSSAAYAKAIGITRQALSQVVTGERQPSESILAKLNLKMVYVEVDPAESNGGNPDELLQHDQARSRQGVERGRKGRQGGRK